MAKCGFKFETQNSRRFEYGPGKEFKTKGEAEEFANKIVNNVKTQISLAGLWKLYEKIEIIEGDGYLQIEITLKEPIIDFEEPEN